MSSDSGFFNSQSFNDIRNVVFLAVESLTTKNQPNKSKNLVQYLFILSLKLRLQSSEVRETIHTKRPVQLQVHGNG